MAAAVAGALALGCAAAETGGTTGSSPASDGVGGKSSTAPGTSVSTSASTGTGGAGGSTTDTGGVGGSTFVGSWTCDPTYYDQTSSQGSAFAICDCNCGAHDPDCDNPTNPVACPGLAGDSYVCVNDVCTVPPTWTCSLATFDEVHHGVANPRCDCSCGAYDPDCDSGSVPITGCESGDACSLKGTCVSPPPKTWTCDAMYYNESGQGLFPTCDCGCGSVDPDCGDATVQSCDICGERGSCGDDTCHTINPANNAVCQ